MAQERDQLEQRLAGIRAKLDVAVRNGVDPRFARLLAADVDRSLALLDRRGHKPS